MIVANAVLENFLQCARLARHQDNPVRRNGDQSILPRTVLKILAYARGERRRSFMPVVLGRYGETLTWPLLNGSCKVFRQPLAALLGS